MKSVLKVAIAGLGMGRMHLAGFEELKSTQTVAICDLNDELLTRFGEQYGIRNRYHDYEEMLATERPDIFVVALPNVLHKSATLAGLKAGAHILCEKPMAMNAKEARQMCEAAKRARRKLMIGLGFRFSAASQALKRLIDGGELGEIYFARSIWHRRRGIPEGWFMNKKLSGGGALVDLGVHRLDLVLWLMGNPEPVSVLGSTYSVFGPEMYGKAFDVDDLACAFIKFSNGASLVLEASWAVERERGEEQQTELMGTKGGAVQYNLGDSYEYEFAVTQESKGSFIRISGAQSDRNDQTLQAYFADCIVRGREPMAGGSEGLRVMTILDAVYKSARTGKAVYFKPT